MGYYSGIRVRVSATPGCLYGDPRPAKKRRQCAGHMADPHWIEVGDMAVLSALPPDTGDIGNPGWWHHTFCLDCAPNVGTAHEVHHLVGEAEGASERG